MKRALISLLERIRADLNDTIAALERDEVDTAVTKIDGVAERIAEWTNEARS